MNQVAIIDQAPLRATPRVSREVVAIIPRDMDEVFRLASATFDARMAPESFKSAQAVAIAIMHGMEVGFTPMAAIQSIAVINGKPSIWGDGALGLIQASGLMEEHEEGVTGEGDTLTGWCRVKRIGKKADEKQFSIADARKAELTGKDPWKKYPQRMVQMRARSWALRDNFSDVLKGFHIAEEALDIEPSARHVTAPVPPPPPKVAIAGATVPTPPALTQQPKEEVAKVAEAIEEDAYSVMQRAQTGGVTPPTPPASKVATPAAAAPAPQPPVPPQAKAPVPPTPPKAAVSRPAASARELDPEALISEFQDALDAQRDGSGVFEAWQDIVSPYLDDLFPPDLKTLESMRDKKLARLA